MLQIFLKQGKIGYDSALESIISRLKEGNKYVRKSVENALKRKKGQVPQFDLSFLLYIKFNLRSEKKGRNWPH